MANTINADNGVSSGSAGLKETADSSGILALQTNGTTAITVDTSQNVGIGTSSPATKVHALTTSATSVAYRAGNSVSYAEFQVDASGNSQLIAPGGVQIFNTNGAERMRIDSSGNVGIGTTSPRNSAGYVGLTLNGSTSSFIDINSNGTRVMTLFGAAADCTLVNPTATGAMIFQTNSTERMRIDSSGNVTIANGTIQTTATADATVGFQLIKVSATVTAGTNKYIQFLTNNGAASTGFIASNGASNAGFFAGSDRRIKTDIHAVSDGVEKVMQLKPSKFKFKENNEQSHGFIAQELNEVFPECVYKPNDGLGEEVPESQEPWAVNLDKLIPYLTAAIQEQQAIITALTARITALESK